MRNTSSLSAAANGVTVPSAPARQYVGVILPRPAVASAKLTASPVAAALNSAQFEWPSAQEAGSRSQFATFGGPIDAPGGRHWESLEPLSASKISRIAGAAQLSF